MPIILNAIGEVRSSEREPACVVIDGSGERFVLFLVFVPEGPAVEGFTPAMFILVWMSDLFFFLPNIDFPVSLDIVIFFINLDRESLVYHCSVGMTL